MQIKLAVLFSENRGKFWSIDCHLLLICFLFIDLQPSSAAPRVQHSGPSNGGLRSGGGGGGGGDKGGDLTNFKIF